MNEDLDHNERLQVIYGDLPLPDEEFEALLDKSLSPRGPDSLLDKAGAWGLSADMHVLDIGCRDARYAVELARRYGCTVLAVDPLDDHIRRAQKLVQDHPDVQNKITIRKGRIEDIPAEDASVDFIWCRDVLSHIPDLPRGLAECRRVLTPGGRMLVYQTFATELLEAREATYLANALAVIPENQAPFFFEQVAYAAGFRIQEVDRIGSEWREHWEETGAAITSNQLLR
ncbi:MAG: class I SAM-dependent methyltransferase, partial [Caldilineae bacterium]